MTAIESASDPAALGRRVRLHFIRHGETEWSVNGRHTGVTDLPLTPRGEEEARELAPWLRAIPFKRALTSPRQRARRTCELAGLTVAAQIEPDLSEWNYGAYEGRRSEEICKDRPGWSIFRDGCPEGESPAQVSDRADRLIARLGALDGDTALFSHGEFGRVLAARWIGAPVTLGRRFALGTASLGILGYDPTHPDTSVISLWNAVPAFPADRR
jgi:probable phosphoglycerate mutase